MLTRTTLCSAAVLFCACGPLVDAQLPGVEICEDVQTIDFPAAPVASEQTFTRHAAWSLSEDLQAQLAGQEFAGALTKVTLRADGEPDLSFLKAAALDATIDGEDTALVWDGTLDDTGAVVIRPDAPLDVTPLLSGATAEVDTTLTGTLPDHPWQLQVRACFTVSAHLTVQP